MSDTVRGFCAQVYEYVKSDMNSDSLYADSYSSPGLERNAEAAAARIDLAGDPQKRHDSMRMMEKTGVLPMLLLKKRDSLDLNQDGDLDREELETVMQDPEASILESIAAEYAISNFDEIRSGWDPFDWFENLEEGEIMSHADDARSSPEKDPGDVYYGEVTSAPPVGSVEEGQRRSCCPTEIE